VERDSKGSGEKERDGKREGHGTRRTGQRRLERCGEYTVVCRSIFVDLH
jgi:hypothetical protein